MRKRILALISASAIVALAFGAVPRAAQAATVYDFYIAPGGNTDDTLAAYNTSCRNPYSHDLQDALNEIGVNPGDPDNTDTIYLCAGTYYGQFDSPDDGRGDLVLVGASPATTILDGQGSLQVIRITSGTVGSLTVKNLTIQNADAFEGSAICQGADIDLTVDRVSFLNNSADDYGAAIGCTSGNSLRVLNSYFEGNDAGSHGGAIDVHQDEGTVIRNSVFENNHSGNGGALGANGSDLDVQRCKFVDNVANNDGGAIWFTSSTISVFRNTFTGNSADQGGAIALRPGLRSQVRRIESANSFRGNVASHTRDRNVGSTDDGWD